MACEKSSNAGALGEALESGAGKRGRAWGMDSAGGEAGGAGLFSCL